MRGIMTDQPTVPDSQVSVSMPASNEGVVDRSGASTRISDRDRLFAGTDAPNADFVFDERVARVFGDMLDRSVPGYPQIIEVIGLIAARYLQPGAPIFDLGCSLGTATAGMLARVRDPALRIIAVDNAEAMIQGLYQRLPDAIASGRVEPRLADICAIDTRGASLVLLNLTLQFLPPDRRLPLLRSIREGLVSGGVLVLVEKVIWEEPETDRLMQGLHADFKRANGYSELEISRKRAALERVLIPDTIETHEARLREAGFARTLRWFQCLNFVGWMAWPDAVATGPSVGMSPGQAPDLGSDLASDAVASG